MKNLVIVESPAKAKTIEQYLGKDFVVRSSYGHIRDLSKKGMGIDIANRFVPSYEISPDKKKTVTELRKLAKEADAVWLATDEDREGEAIAWHLAEALNLDVTATKRIVFHEITKPAITQAVANPRQVDLNLVNAQQARRILDRVVGFELSPILWKKIRTGLSAGRVQSVAVRLIVEREREVDGFVPSVSFKVSGELYTLNAQGQTDEILPVKRLAAFDDEASAQAYLASLTGATFRVAQLDQKPAKRSPKPPFTTSTLQQEASQKLGFSVKQTMVIAQRLYESGKITYMRTDSVNLSEVAIGQAKEVITQRFGANYSHPRRYKTKQADAQEAHEAIRPTDFSVTEVGGERNEQRLYQLIWARALASQMSEAELLRSQVDIAIAPSNNEVLVAKGEIVTFEGFMKVYNLEGQKDQDVLLPALQVGQALQPGLLQAKQSFSRAPARYNEASLVRTLEEMGIGRPSTYAPTIDTIQQRGYVIKEDREGTPRAVRLLSWQAGQVKAETLEEITGSEKSKLFPTDIAGIVNDFLVKNFGEVLDFQFTAQVEAKFDQIAMGQQAWQDMLEDFYGKFHPNVELAETLSREEAGQARLLGNDPKTGKPMLVKIGRFGPFVQLGDGENDEKPTFASLKPGQKMDTIKLEEALELFKLPRTLGEMPEAYHATAADGTPFGVEQGQLIIAKQGPFGPYLEYGEKQFAPIKGYDPLSITLEEAVVMIEAKIQADADKIVRSFPGSDVKILKGRWGPYITDIVTKVNAKIAKDEDPMSLTLAECNDRLAAAPPPKKRGRVVAAKKPVAKKAPAKKTTAKPAAKKTTGTTPKKVPAKK